MSSHPKTFSDVWVVGMHFRGPEAKDYAAALQIGVELFLRREPFNQYDSNAIMVFANETFHLGYVEWESASFIAPHLDEGAEYRAVVEAKTERKGNIHPVLELTLIDGDAGAEAD